MFRSFLLIMLIASVMVSCGSKAELSFHSPDNTSHLEIKASKSSSLDPWILELKAQNEKMEKTFNIEFFQSELNTETIRVEWNGNSEATLILTGQDNFTNHFIVLFQNDQITLTNWR